MPAIVKNSFTKVDDDTTLLEIESTKTGINLFKIDTFMRDRIEALGTWRYNKVTGQVTTKWNNIIITLQRYVAFVANGNHDTGYVTQPQKNDFRVKQMMIRVFGTPEGVLTEPMINKT